jgi:hypothetical protein
VVLACTLFAVSFKILHSMFKTQVMHAAADAVQLMHAAAHDHDCT